MNCRDAYLVHADSVCMKLFKENEAKVNMNMIDR